MKKLVFAVFLLPLTFPGFAQSYRFKQTVPGVTQRTCALPAALGGGTLTDGQSYTAPGNAPVYSAATVSHPATCAASVTTVSCAQGVLSAPTASLTCKEVDPNYSNVVYLMHLAGDYSDASSKHRTSYNGGGTGFSAGVGPFGGSALYFNGTSNAEVYTADSPDFAFGSGDVTIESFVKWDGSVRPTYGAISLWGQNCGSNSNMRVIVGSSGGLDGYGNSDSSRPISTAAGTLPANQWAHVAYTKQGTTYRLYVNGAKVGQGTGPATLSDIGCNWEVGSEEFVNISLQGVMAEFRVTKGVARYTGNNFTVPTTPFPNSAN